MKKCDFLTSGSLLLIFVPSLFYLYFRQKRNIALLNNQKSELEWYEYRIEKQKYKLHHEIFTENAIAKNFRLINLNNDTVEVLSLLDTPKLIYRFLENSCESCIDDDISLIKELGESIGYQKIIIATDFENTRLLKEFINRKGIISSCYILKEELNLSLEPESSRRKGAFYFILDNNLRIRFAYISDDYPDFNKIYMNRICEYFNKGY